MTWHDGAGDWDPAELDGLYATRVLLECLALSMALSMVQPTQIWTQIRRLTAVDRADGSRTVQGWLAQDDDVHRHLTVDAGSAIARRLRALAERESRLVARRGPTRADAALSSTGEDHAEILAALRAGDGPAAVGALAQHISNRGARVMAALAPGFQVVMLPRAVRLIDEGRDLMLE